MRELVIFILLIFLSAIFSSGETSFTLLDKTRLRLKARGGDRRAKLLFSLWEKPELFFTPLLIGNNLVNITASVILTAVFVKIWGELGALISTILVTIVVLYFAELLPKALAARFPNLMSRVLFYPLFVIFVLLAPLSLIFNSSLRLLHKAVPGLKSRSSLFSREEVQAIASSWGKEELSEILDRALVFSQKTVGEIMVPRVDIKAFPEEKPVLELLREAQSMRYSRFPIYRGTVDHIVGVLYLKDLLEIKLDSALIAGALAKPPFFLVESLPLIPALEEMRDKRTSLALVVDEYGGISGLITLEDILEEIVGEIWDEYDRPVSLIKEEPGGLVVDARIAMAELADRYRLPIKSETVTLGGFLEELAGGIPSPGQKFTVEGVCFEVLESTNKAVKRVLITFPNHV
ncbi:MAG: hemolysin family protein [Caldiserica bacterium]|jgi:CBS domain containing-hemolysin-like protein|nr:hemolysin family protein [Caldisericota bacterium]